jgi:uncharacterized protein (TIGR02996 family)
MNDRESLLRAVLASPLDDLPRLALADYLGETGDPDGEARASYIRMACLAEDGLRRKFPEGGGALAIMQRGGRSADQWTPTAIGILIEVPHPGASLTVHRGFVSEVECDGPRWVGIAGDITRRHPVEAVRLRTRPLVTARPDGPRRTSLLRLDGTSAMMSVSDIDLDSLRPADAERFFTLALLRAAWPSIEFALPEACPPQAGRWRPDGR